MSFEPSEPLVLEGSSSQSERPLLGPRLTILFAIPLTGLALWMMYEQVGHVVEVMSGFKMLLMASYAVWLMLCFWASKAYKDGLTWKEAALVVLWPLTLFHDIRRGVGVLRGRAIGQERDHFGRKPVSENWAFCIGVDASVAVAWWWAKTVLGALDDTPELISMAGFVWTVGMVAYFWTAEAWRNGLTLKEAFLVVAWPIGMLTIVAQGVKRFG